jgi:invasion protein IalB
MRTRVSITLAFAAAALAGLAAPAAAQGPVKAEHGDWQIRCEEQQIGGNPPREHCALVQSVADEEKPNVTLVVIVFKTATDRILRVVAPLNILLPSGLGLKIDDKEVGRAGFVKCLAIGCYAEVVMDNQLVERLKTGKIATFIIFPTPDEGIGIPVSLAGFAQGFDALP